MSLARVVRNFTKMTPGTFGGEAKAATPAQFRPLGSRIGGPAGTFNGDAKAATPPSCPFAFGPITSKPGPPSIAASSSYTAEPGEMSFTLTYPAGQAGDTLLVWLSIADAQAPTLTGDLTAGELLTTIVSTGRLRVYSRTRQAGDASVTFTVLSATVRMVAIAANLGSGFDTSNPTTSGVFANTTTVSPSSAADGPGLLCTWFSFSEMQLTPAGTALASPNPDGDFTVGMELRLYQIAASTVITQTAPTNPSLSLFIRAVSYTTIPT